MSAKITNKSGVDANAALRKATQNYLNALEDEEFKAVERASIFVEGEAKRNIKTIKSSEDRLIDTGRMINSITHSVTRSFKKIIGLVGTNVFYAKYQELGTPNIPPRPFLRPALNNNFKRVKEILAAGVNKAARKVDKS